ncbi:threonine synthase [Ferruginibacter albus]|uniref:threonine synthase n=1 Tax=Ferruginibacter albus TaxID=2875540 RepID=UPI001CC47FEE|nr:threonine synthase [Ferruginibacter albus]UAY51963.1 threonine synthase [Ferruginibacter albus]
MLYRSTNHQSPLVNFREATLKGQPDDKGLYFPDKIPVLAEDFIENIIDLSEEEIAYEIIAPYVKGAIPAPDLARILVDVVNFKIPVTQVSKTISALELYHGPSLTFKDMGATFMRLCLEYFLQQQDKRTIVLEVTSGDGGAAIAKAFYDMDGVEVVILYPAGKINMVQEKQITSLGNNIHAIEVEGTIEDCKAIAKQIFEDAALQEKFNFTSASSSNVARWIPLQFYYFFAYKQWIDKVEPPAIAVPCGNLGNLSAGLLAYKSGLPISHFIAACNVNDVFPEFLRTGNYQPKKIIPTISNALDIGEPINLPRVIEIFNADINEIKKVITGYSITDAETKKAIRLVYERNGYLLDPHGAVAYVAMQKYLHENPDQKGVVLKTAHPVKFFEVVEPVIDEPGPMPSSVELELEKKKIYRKMNVDANVLKEFIFSL